MLKKTWQKTITLTLLLAIILSLQPAHAINATDQPASILVLTAEGKPERIYGNKNIDWQAIGYDKADRLELTDFEQYLLKQKAPAKHIAFAQDYRLIDHKVQYGASITVLEFTNWLCQVFYQSNYSYKTRTDFDARDVTIAIAEENNLFLDITDQLENLNKKNTEKLLERLFASFGQANVDLDKYIPERFDKNGACEMLYRLAQDLPTTPPPDKFVYSNTPVIPIIIQPVKCWWDTYNDFHGTSWRILNNDRNQTGYLSNGKPINEENINELLRLAEQVFPDATMWTSKKQKEDAGFTDAWVNNNYNNPSQEMQGLYLTQFNVSPKTACGGFCSFLSDLLFGQTANPVRVTDVNNLHTGDIRIEEYLTYDMRSTKGLVAHTVFLTRVDPEAKLYDYADGNNNLCVFWNSWHDRKPPQNAAVTDYDGTWRSQYLYYTRWPE